MTSLHASACAWQGAGVLLLGPPGSGKSELALRLIDRGWGLVADDQTRLLRQGSGLLAQAPATLAGMLEVRGLGLVEGLPHAPAMLALVVECLPSDQVTRLPEARSWTHAGVELPLIGLHASSAATPAKLLMALDCLAGRHRLRAGAWGD